MRGYMAAMISAGSAAYFLAVLSSTVCTKPYGCFWRVEAAGTVKALYNWGVKVELFAD